MVAMVTTRLSTAQEVSLHMHTSPKMVGSILMKPSDTQSITMVEFISCPWRFTKSGTLLAYNILMWEARSCGQVTMVIHQTCDYTTTTLLEYSPYTVLLKIQISYTHSVTNMFSSIFFLLTILPWTLPKPNYRHQLLQYRMRLQEYDPYTVLPITRLLWHRHVFNISFCLNLGRWTGGGGDGWYIFRFFIIFIIYSF